jgi:antitoxin (DNA-binding transcriptional repressor) of toxin-antitoxin stability system
MKTIAAGLFKQICLRLLDEVRETGRAVVITKRGRPVAQLAPLSPSAVGDWSGAMRGTGKILGDLVAPATDEQEWEALRD